MEADQINVFTELLNLVIASDKDICRAGGRSVAPIVNRFFEDMIFEQQKIVTKKENKL